MTLRMIVVVPLMQLIIFGYAINYDVKHLKMVVLDESRSYESRELVAQDGSQPVLRRGRPRRSLDELQTRSTRRTRVVGLVIDRDFGRTATAAQPAQALLIVNASDSTTSTAGDVDRLRRSPTACRSRRSGSKALERRASCRSMCASGPGTTRT